ncbi:MAG: histidine--tRNA ligase [Deltaproteobacteria bacterium]
MTITAVRGFNDILPDEAELWRWLEGTAARVFSSYGYSEIRVPVVEKTGLFQRSIGETTDIVEKEMYSFPDRAGDSLTLRPEGTASVARAYIEHKLYQRPVQKLFYMGPMFRYERPQKGRYRQFYQIGAEVLGDLSPLSDAETIEMLMVFFNSVGLKDYGLEINSLGCPECRPGYKKTLLDFLAALKPSLCANCSGRMEKNPLRSLDCKNPGCMEATKDAPLLSGFLCAQCASHFEKVRQRLAALGVEATVNPRIVRGLDYYTKTAFEVVARGLGSQNAVAAGGRYDGLVKDLGGPETPCFGFAIGLERLALCVKDAKFKHAPVIAFIPLGGPATEKGAGLLRELRQRGLKVVEDFSEAGLKGRMKAAHRAGARYALILGDDELRDGVITLKDMASGEQEKTGLADIADKLLLRV